MYIKDLVNKDEFNLVTQNTDLNKEIKYGYVGDLLSWVMGHAKKESAWITVQTHINIIAVASLLEISCIIIPENIKVETDTIKKANEEDITIICSSLNAYQISALLSTKGIK